MTPTTTTLQELRRASHLTLADVGRALNITRQAYWRKEAGLRPLRAPEIQILADLFCVSCEDILRARTTLNKQA